MANIALAPRYRVRVYAPRSADATETTVLTPAAGAPHSDKFLVATATGVSGTDGTYKAYLDIPTGQRGRTDTLTCVRSIGSWTWRLLDKRTTAGGSDLNRWITAFFGDGAGKAQLLGLRWVAEVDWGDGAGWVAHSVGRIQYVDSDDSGALWWQFTVRETVDELKGDIFVGRPHGSATAASITKLFPVWYNSITYGPWTAISPAVVTRMMVALKNDQSMTLAQAVGVPGPTHFMSQSRIITEALTKFLASSATQPPLKTARVRATWISAAGALNGTTTEYWLGTGGSEAYGAQITGLQFQCYPLDATDPTYGALAPVAGVADIEILAYGAPTEDSPFWIGDIHPAQLIKDVLDGYYGYRKADGSVYRAYPYDGTALAALIADTSFMTARFCVVKTWDAKEFIESQILTAFGIGYYEDATGKLIFYDARQPTSIAGLVTLDADDYRVDTLRWQHGRSAAITQFTVVAYVDSPQTIPQVHDRNNPSPLLPSLIASREQLYPFLDFGRLDMGQKAYKLDATGLRTTPLANDANANKVPRATALYTYIQTLVDQYRRPYAAGATTLTGSFRRTTAVTGLHEGSLTLVNVLPLPDPTSNTRAGTRLMRVTQLTPGADGAINMELLDLGQNVTAGTPTIGTPTANASDATQLVDIVVTPNAGLDPVDVWYNATATSVGSRPADTAAGWTFTGHRATTGTMVFAVPGNRRIWVRARSNPSNTGLKLPSAYVYPSGTGYVDIGALTAPSAVSVTPSALAAAVSWTAGAATSWTEVSLDNFTVILLRYGPGTTSTLLTGLTASTGYTVYLRHTNLAGGTSAIVSRGFTTTSTPTVCPDMNGIEVAVGGVT